MHSKEPKVVFYGVFEKYLEPFCNRRGAYVPFNFEKKYYMHSKES